MISGVLYALLAGLMWGADFSLARCWCRNIRRCCSRWGAIWRWDLSPLPLAWLGRARLRQLNGKDWWTALALTMMGNLIYYFCLASAIQRTGAPVSTMIIGTPAGSTAGVRQPAV